MAGNWILVGMMGAGKTSVGKLLAECSGREFVDTDLLLQNRFGRSIAQFFALYGEAAFRDHETDILSQLAHREAVISTGGGIILREQNWEQFRRLGKTVYLQAKPETLIQRLVLSKRKRPLLASDDWEDKLRDLLESRRPLYERADYVVPIDDGTVEEACERVLNLLEPARP